jgi:hypothetical protein
LVVLSFSPRQCRWSGAALVVGLGVGGCLLAVPWWCFGRCRTYPGGPVGVVWMAGSLFGGECVAGVVFSGRKPLPSVALVVAPLGVALPAEGTIED